MLFSRRKNITAFLFLIILITIITVRDLPLLWRPFFGHHEFNGVFYSQIARNYLRYGMLLTKGAQIINGGTVPAQDWHFHTHHPVTYPFILAAVFSITSVSELTARLVSFIASLTGLIVLGKLIKNKFALLPVAITPLFAYYHMLPVYEPLLLPLVALSLYAYEKRKPRWLFFSVLAAVLIDWPGYWPGVWIIIFEIFGKKNWPLIRSCSGGIILGTVLILSHQYIITGNVLKALLDIGLYRLEAAQQPYTMVEWLRLLISRSKAFLGLPLIMTVIGGSLLSFFNKDRFKLLMLSFCIGMTHIVVFRNITWYHDYMLFHLIPFLTIGTDMLLERFKYMSKWLPAIAACVIAVTTYATTVKFYDALIGLQPHRTCLTKSALEMSHGEAEQCDPFRIYYSDNFRFAGTSVNLKN